MLEAHLNIARFPSAAPDNYDKQSHSDEQRLGLFDYDPEQF